MIKKADIGLIGLAVMGENLVMNMESKGFTVSVYNRTVEKVDNFVNGRAMARTSLAPTPWRSWFLSWRSPARS